MPRWSLLLLFLTAGLDAQTPERPSHRSLGTLGDLSSPEEMAAGRLRGARATKDKRDDLLLDKDVQELARSLMKNPEFLKSLKNAIPPEQLKSLAERFRNGEAMPDLAKDPALQKLFREDISSPKLDDKQRELLKKWGDKNPVPTLTPEKTPPGLTQPLPKITPPITVPQPKQEMPAWVRDRLERWTGDAEKWAKTPAAKTWADVIRRIAEGKRSSENLVTGALSRTRGLGSYLPRFGDYVPRISPPRLPPVRLPSLAGGPMPSAAGVGSFLQTALLLLVVGVLVVALWRGAGWAQAIAEARRKAWRLGPWPVTIDAVRTREQLVRAFEYLSLLLLGRAALTRHHHALARDIAGQPDMRPDERRESADTLAALYEQARYAPPADDLSEQQLEQARRELRRLAGGTA